MQLRRIHRFAVLLVFLTQVLFATEGILPRCTGLLLIPDPPEYPLPIVPIPQELVAAAREVEHIRFAPLSEGVSAQQRAERILGFDLGEARFQGGFRFIFLHPKDPRKVIKLYDPSLLEAEYYDVFERERIMTITLQRELALETYLRGQGFHLAHIDRTRPDLLRNGIVIQDRQLGENFRDMTTIGEAELKAVNAFIDRLSHLDAAVHEFFFEKHGGFQLSNRVGRTRLHRFGYAIESSIPGESFEYIVGIDIGSDHGNLIWEGKSVVMVDW